MDRIILTLFNCNLSTTTVRFPTMENWWCCVVKSFDTSSSSEKERLRQNLKKYSGVSQKCAEWMLRKNISLPVSISSLFILCLELDIRWSFCSCKEEGSRSYSRRKQTLVRCFQRFWYLCYMDSSDGCFPKLWSIGWNRLAILILSHLWSKEFVCLCIVYFVNKNSPRAKIMTLSPGTAPGASVPLDLVNIWKDLRTSIVCGWMKEENVWALLMILMQVRLTFWWGFIALVVVISQKNVLLTLVLTETIVNAPHSMSWVCVWHQ